jgi:hypothetical protein
MTFDEAVAFALTLPGTELGKSYGKPAVTVASNGRAFLFPSHEADTSFGVAIDLDTIEILKETDPETFWQTSIMSVGKACSSATIASTRSVSAT